jgi:hypothetical protein
MSIFSVAASTTNAAFSIPFSIEVKVEILLSVASLVASVIVPLALWRSKFLAIVANALSS